MPKTVTSKIILATRGSALALACRMFGLECTVYMVKVSYEQKPYRRMLMNTWGAEVFPSPSAKTHSGQAVLAAHPDSPGSLGIAISEAVGIPTGGDTVIHERIHLIAPDTLADDLVIEAPHILTRPYETRRLSYRNRKRSYEIVEGVCRQGDFEEATDKWGNPVYKITHQQDGNILPPPVK